MLDTLTIESFEPHVGTPFGLHAGDRRIELRLARAARVMDSEAARLPRTPFSLFFLAPLLLPQQIFPAHPRGIRGAARRLPRSDRAGRERLHLRGGVHVSAVGPGAGSRTLSRRQFASALVGVVLLLASERSAIAAPDGAKSAAPEVTLEGRLSRAVFRALEGQEFSLLLANRPPATLRLLRVDEAGRGDGGQFSVVFQGPADLKMLEGTYRVTHTTAGTTDLYLRPKGRDDRFSYYEAPFNVLPENAETASPPIRSPRRYERPLYEPPGR